MLPYVTVTHLCRNVIRDPRDRHRIRHGVHGYASMDGAESSQKDISAPVQRRSAEKAQCLVNESAIDQTNEVYEPCVCVCRCNSFKMKTYFAISCSIPQNKQHTHTFPFFSSIVSQIKGQILLFWKNLAIRNLGSLLATLETQVSPQPELCSTRATPADSLTTNTETKHGISFDMYFITTDSCPPYHTVPSSSGTVSSTNRI